jgi:hypothetical protein
MPLIVPLGKVIFFLLLHNENGKDDRPIENKLKLMVEVMIGYLTSRIIQVPKFYELTKC